MPATLAYVALVLALAGAIEGPPASHPALRTSPKPANRPLDKGPRKFVASDGDDQGDGGENRPWRTISHALTQIQPGETLVLRGGTYYERVYLARRATQEQPLTIRAYPGEQVVLDGGLAEFFTSPEQCWQPAESGAPGEYVSKKAYLNLRDVIGSFGDSLVGLQTYYHAIDLRATGELVDWENWESTGTTDLKPLYCGPGLWYDHATGRIHCRLVHTHLPAPVANYKGETDPREVPLLIAPFGATPLFLDGARHIRLQDLTIRGAGYTAVRTVNSQDIELDNCTIWCGTYGLQATATERLHLHHSRIWGSLAPWTFRADASKRDYPGRPHRNISRLNTHALIEIDAGRESSVFAYPQNDHWEIDHCHFADAHDGVYLGTINCHFHHNLIENLQDDGIYLSPMYLRHRLEKTDPELHVYSNLFRQMLTPLAFGGDVPETNDTVFIYRNVADLRRPVLTGRPSTKQAEPGISFGKPMGDHGSPPWARMNIYHNTFILAEPARDVAMATLSLSKSGHPRRLFNNLYLHLARLPGYTPNGPEADIVTDGNCYWSPLADEKQAETLLKKFLASESFTASKQRYSVGNETHSRVADPKLTRLDADPFAAADYRPAVGSALLDAGVAIPAEWPDPYRQLDAGKPDIGALPLAGTKPAPQE
ncbi:MAG: hypothetical protein SFU86_25160 [Pirellulaceae bacterium]|nr:hypothetical protein [Pirellulaceae bacterium]